MGISIEDAARMSGKSKQEIEVLIYGESQINIKKVQTPTRKIFIINPVPKPRMTQSDRWKKRPCTQRYWEYKDEIRKQMKDWIMPESGYHMIFHIPVPQSWSKKKKAEMIGRPHQQKPDKDNLEKAFLDSIFEEDCHIWDGRVTKIWGEVGMIIVDKI